MSLPTVDVIACEGRARRVLINQINADLSAKQPGGDCAKRARLVLICLRGTLLHSAVRSRRPRRLHYFLDSVVRTSGRTTIRLGTTVRDRHIGHEPPLVARSCSPAKLLGSVSVVGTPRCLDAWRSHSRGWHSQRAPAAMPAGRPSCFRPLNGVRVSSTCSRSS